MSTKSKRRIARRAGHETTSGPSSEQVPTQEKEVLGAVMGALISAITFGAVEDAPRSHRQP